MDVQAGLRVASANDAIHIYSEGTLANPEPLGMFDPEFIMIPEGIMMGDVLYGRSLTQTRSVSAVDLNAGSRTSLGLQFGVRVRDQGHGPPG